MSTTKRPRGSVGRSTPSSDADCVEWTKTHEQQFRSAALYTERLSMSDQPEPVSYRVEEEMDGVRTSTALAADGQVIGSVSLGFPESHPLLDVGAEDAVCALSASLLTGLDCSYSDPPHVAGD